MAGPPARDLKGYTDSVTGTWSMVTGSGSSGYDSLNRLSAATQTPAPVNGVAQNPQSYCWTYDGFGNRTTQATSNDAFTNGVGATGCTTPGTLLSNAWANMSPANNNRLANTSQAVAGVPYDASGDVLSDGTTQYLYDGDGRICAVASSPVAGTAVLTGYLYDAEGTRIAKGTIQAWSCDPAISQFTPTTDYVLGPSGEQVTEMGLDSNNTIAWQHTNVFAGGKLIATYDNDGLHFYLDDPLGTRRAQTDYEGVLEQTCYSLPFGDGLSCTGSTTSPTEQHFTGKERDAESGNDYFMARYFTSRMGRFMSPDWSVKVEPVPYAKLGDPQSLNLYAYMLNNPLSGVDADGHASEGAFNQPTGGEATDDPRYNELREFTASLFAGDGSATAMAAMAQQQNGQQGIDNSLKYKTVTGGQRQGPWEINWSLKHNSKKGGFIVQHIVADFGDAGHFDYYEAWPVAPGKHTPSIQGVDGNGNLYSDMFSGPDGSHIHGSARFYEGLNLPDSFTVHPPGFPAGILRGCPGCS